MPRITRDTWENIAEKDLHWSYFGEDEWVGSETKSEHDKIWGMVNTSTQEEAGSTQETLQNLPDTAQNTEPETVGSPPAKEMDDLAGCFAGSFKVTNVPNDTNRPHPRFAMYKMKNSVSNQEQRRQRLLGHQKAKRDDLINHARLELNLRPGVLMSHPRATAGSPPGLSSQSPGNSMESGSAPPEGSTPNPSPLTLAP